MNSVRVPSPRFCVWQGLDRVIAERERAERVAGPGSGSEDSDDSDSDYSGSEAEESDCEMDHKPDYDDCYSEESDVSDDDEDTDCETPNARGGPTRLCVGLDQWLRVVPQ